MNADRLNREVVYCEMELERERDPNRRLWLLTRIRDAKRDLLEIDRDERRQLERFNENLEKAVALAMAKRRDAEK